MPAMAPLRKTVARKEAEPTAVAVGLDILQFGALCRAIRKYFESPLSAGEQKEVAARVEAKITPNKTELGDLAYAPKAFLMQTQLRELMEESKKPAKVELDLSA